MQPNASLPWFTSRPYLDTLARLVALAVPMKRRQPVWYHRPPTSKRSK